jgi:hypothetical protein
MTLKGKAVFGGYLAPTGGGIGRGGFTALLRHREQRQVRDWMTRVVRSARRQWNPAS